MQETVQISRFNRVGIATGIAILFHLIGLVGILGGWKETILQTTPIHLLLMMLLVFYTQRASVGFYLFAIGCIVLGYVAEYIGIHTGYLFGEYIYGTVLGPRLESVPIIIGVNWFLVIFSSGMSFSLMFDRLRARFEEPEAGVGKWRFLAVMMDAATLAVLFDWLMEPVAIKLGYWSWKNNEVPLFNYSSWFIVSLVMMGLFTAFRFEKNNRFGLNLLLIQFMFFLVLRTFL